jgi:hypothetical protein
MAATRRVDFSIVVASFRAAITPPYVLGLRHKTSGAGLNWD